MYKKMITTCYVMSSFLMMASVQQGGNFVKDKPLEYRENASQRKYRLLNVETVNDFVIVATHSNEGDSVITTEKEFLRVLNDDKDKKLFVVNHALSKGYTGFDLFAIDTCNQRLSIEQPVILDFICTSTGCFSLEDICLLQDKLDDGESMKNYNSLSAQVSQEMSFEEV